MGRRPQAAGLSPAGKGVQDWLRARLANDKLPRVVAFHDSLPREDTGNIFKRRLREPCWQGVARRI